MMFEFKRIGIDEKAEIKALFVSVFTNAPWNDDWSDETQLDLYINDLIGQSNSLTYGLYENDELIGISLGFIKHWFRGTEYNIDELCIRTDTFAPAYGFYKKRGFVEEAGHVSFSKKV